MTAAHTTINIPATAETHRLRRFVATGVALAAMTASGTLAWRVAAHDETAPRYQGPVAPYVPVEMPRYEGPVAPFVPVEIPRYQGPVAPFVGAPDLAELGIVIDTPDNN